MTLNQFIAWLAVREFKEHDTQILGKTTFRCFYKEMNHIDHRFRFTDSKEYPEMSIYYESCPLFKWEIKKVGILKDLKVSEDGKLSGFHKNK